MTPFEAQLRDGDAVMWVIDKDHINDGHNKGVKSANYAMEFEHLCVHKFKIYDDDGELYYEGCSTNQDSETAFEPMDWATYNDGATEIKYLSKRTNNWETL